MPFIPTRKILQKGNIMRELRDYLFITVGLLIYSVGFNAFLLPYEITSGGAAGIGSVIFYGTGFPVAYTYLILNAFLLIFAIKILGWRFCVKTVYAVFVLSFFFQLGAEFFTTYGAAHADEFVISSKGFPQIVKDDAFMSTVIGACFQGIALGIVFLNNGSTGGTDVIAAIVNKYRDMSLGQVILLFDIMIVTSSLLLPSVGISQVIYGYCTLIIVGFMIDFVVDKGRQSVQFFIFSKNYKEIADAIVSTGRGVTLIDGTGWYTKAPRKVLIVLAKKSESPKIFRFIHNVDPDAFVSQSKVIGVYGPGFDPMKVKKKKIKNETAKISTPKKISSPHNQTQE